MLFDSIFWEAGAWMIRIVMIPVIGMRKDDPATSLAWVALVFFSPWLGLVLYLLAGEYGLSRPGLSRRLKNHRNFHLANVKHHDIPALEESRVSREYQVVVDLAARHGGLPLLGGNRVKLIGDTSDFIASLIRDIGRARKHIHLLFYIFRNDQTGKTV
ncbi:MAG: PLDc N-terminal domain-containing protein, partial [Desulfonatronovibrio sp.]